MQTVTILRSHYITEGQYVAIIAHIIMYKDETGHISNFLVRNLIVVQWGNKGGEGEGEVD